VLLFSHLRTAFYDNIYTIKREIQLYVSELAESLRPKRRVAVRIRRIRIHRRSVSVPEDLAKIQMFKLTKRYFRLLVIVPTMFDRMTVEGSSTSRSDEPDAGQLKVISTAAASNFHLSSIFNS
jgi:hypothetical protein